MKHAYLILAHNEWQLLQTLINCIDDERNDIYVHIDAKVKGLPALNATKSEFVMLDERINVHWGDLSVVEAEYALLKVAALNGPYEYYHLLSGVDLPLKSQDYIHEFCARNSGKEFIGFSTYDYASELFVKANLWHLFPHDFKNVSLIKHILRTGYLKVQKLLHITRNKTLTMKKGTQWVSVTDGFIRMLLASEQYVMKSFSHTFCPDEIYKQTLCWNSEFKNNVYDLTDEGNGSMRAIGWKDGQLLDWRPSDYDELKDSSAMFARKFNSRDMEFVRRITALTK